MRIPTILVALTAFAAAASSAAAQEHAREEVVTIPKAEYQALLDEHQQLVAQMKEMQAFKAKLEQLQASQPPTSQVQTSPQAADQAETDQALDELDQKIEQVKKTAKDSFPGSTKFLLAGYGTGDFIAQNNGGDRKFGAAFNPILLWKLNDRLLFEGELEAELEGSDTSIALELAQISYVVNDYLTIGAGKFLNPMDYFVERQHMGWVNKFPDKPLAVYDGLLPETELGVQVRGTVPIGEAKLGYALFVSNANALNSDESAFAPEELGTLTFDNFDNVGRHFAVGGRVGFFPIPELEVGYGFQVADVAPPHTRSVHSVAHSVDLSYVPELDALQGVLNLKAQWVWSHIDRFTYDPGGLIGGPFDFRNVRNGGYVQLAFRPSRLGNPILRNLEPVFRFDRLSQARTPTGVNENRYSIGLDYWLGPSSVVKAAYEFDDQSGPNADDHDGLLLQFATGF